MARPDLRRCRTLLPALAIALCAGLAACAAPSGAVPGALPAGSAVPAASPAVPGLQPASLPLSGATDPARLGGLAAGEVEALLGAPAYLRRDPPAEVWQYVGEGCVLDLFLYEEGGVRKVTHQQLRSLTGEAVSPRCLAKPAATPARAG